MFSSSFLLQVVNASRNRCIADARRCTHVPCLLRSTRDLHRISIPHQGNDAPPIPTGAPSAPIVPAESNPAGDAPTGAGNGMASPLCWPRIGVDASDRAESPVRSRATAAMQAIRIEDDELPGCLRAAEPAAPRPIPAPFTRASHEARPTTELLLRPHTENEPVPNDPTTLTAIEAAARIASGELSSEALVGACLARIEAREPVVAAWSHVDPCLALEQARACDRIAPVGPLHGVPVGIKDIVDTRDQPTTYGSRACTAFTPAEDAACVAALREAGAVILGKTVTTEFANRDPGTDIPSAQSPAYTRRGRPAAPRRPSPTAWCRWRWRARPQARRFALPPTAGYTDSSRRSACCRWRGWGRSASDSTRSGCMRAASPILHCCVMRCSVSMSRA